MCLIQYASVFEYKDILLKHNAQLLQVYQVLLDKYRVLNYHVIWRKFFECFLLYA
nr:MAG TPA: hypothetical protein [Caudoviricetes sp.]